MLFKSYIPGNDTFVFILNLDISRPVLHSTFDIQMGKIDIDNMSSVYIRRPLVSTIVFSLLFHVLDGFMTRNLHCNCLPVVWPL